MGQMFGCPTISMYQGGGASVTRRTRYGWRRDGKPGSIDRAFRTRPFLKRLSGNHERPLLAYERRTPCTCGWCGRYLPNGMDAPSAMACSMGKCHCEDAA